MYEVTDQDGGYLEVQDNEGSIADSVDESQPGASIDAEQETGNYSPAMDNTSQLPPESGEPQASGQSGDATTAL